MITFRLATKEDLLDLCEIRKKQLVHEGIEPCVSIDQQLQDFFTKFLDNHQIYEILAFDQGKIIATGAVCFYDYPPTYTNQSGKIAYITNMFTEPHYRKQGIATQILHMLEEEVKRRHVEIMRLGASQLGRPVYEKFGFQQDTIWLSKKTN